MGMLYTSVPGLLGDELRTRLLDYALAQQPLFAPSMVTDGEASKVDLNYRVSARLEDLGELHDAFAQRIYALVPALIKDLGITPFHASDLEIELVAHGDGAYFKRHIDTVTGSGRTPASMDRMISLVYYFYREPKSFNGGELCLYPFPFPLKAAMPKRVDIAIEQDLAVAFPSWVEHEVRRIGIPSGDFGDSRFAINCWVLRDRPVMAQTADSKPQE